ncbi:hypothetical protein MKX01_024831 [Papaver californicum]|nr:hypothetical protein MKX01_024831 [Papaver californicum]
MKDLDLTRLFTTEKVFDSKEAIQKWCMEQGKKKNYVVVCKLSRIKFFDGNGKGSYVEIQCEGIYISHKSKTHVWKTPMKRKRRSSTKKCGCRFMLSALCKDDGKWHLRGRCGVHNHALPKKLTGHTFIAILTEMEMKIVEDMTKAGNRPQMILCTLKEANPNSHCTMRTIYNARAKIKANWNEGRSSMQQFLKLAEEHKYNVD